MSRTEVSINLKWSKFVISVFLVALFATGALSNVANAATPSSVDGRVRTQEGAWGYGWVVWDKWVYKYFYGAWHDGPECYGGSNGMQCAFQKKQVSQGVGREPLQFPYNN
jgi:hypothetical protein